MQSSDADNGIEVPSQASHPTALHLSFTSFTVDETIWLQYQREPLNIFHLFVLPMHIQSKYCYFHLQISYFDTHNDSSKPSVLNYVQKFSFSHQPSRKPCVLQQCHIYCAMAFIDIETGYSLYLSLIYSNRSLKVQCCTHHY